jgi:NAD(P)-dependent dehydrogenase (short-subunit alcohol dehydrogenase family)
MYNLADKTVIVTGANAGIGKAAAIQLARCGASVVMACRSPERGERALLEVRAESGSPHVELMLVDMASQGSIRHFAETFRAEHQQLDVLIHNAANFDHTLHRPVLTEDGVETIFATNHVGPFLLTKLLLDLLTATQGRIITVASKGLVSFPFMAIDFNNLNGERTFGTTRAYYQSKLAQVMYTLALAQRLEGTGATVQCVRVTNVAIPDERLAHLAGWQRAAYSIKRRFAITPERQAETYVFLAADPEAGLVNGAYWDENNRQVRANRHAYDRAAQERLWRVTEQMAGLDEAAG